MASLKRLLRDFKRRLVGPARQGVRPLRRHALLNADALVTTNEITDRHGTGVILGRIFGDSPGILSVRSTNLYHEQHLGAERLLLSQDGLSRAQSFERVLYALNGSRVNRVLCVPFLPDELVTAIALKELFGAPLCLYLMDDNNVFARGIPDELMREALAKASLRLAISPEMRDAYENKYGLKFWIVPPVVTGEAVRTVAHPVEEEFAQNRTGILIGNLWSRHWLDQLRKAVRESGVQLHWYGNTKAPWLKVTRQELLRDGIIDCGFLPEAELSERLSHYPYAIIPSGSLDGQEDRPEIARLSLPTRMTYLLAAGNTPMIVLGSPQTAAARFVTRFAVGTSVPYAGADLHDAISEICQPRNQLTLRRAAARHAAHFSASGLADWIWRSLDACEPCDERFERIFRREKSQIVPYLEPPLPKDLWGDFGLVYQALRRLKFKSFCPDFVVDVGASSGVWSDAAHRVFPGARFLLIDPLLSRYQEMNDWYFRQHPQFECVAVALSDSPGEAQLRVSEDLYGSSLFYPGDSRTYQEIKVPVLTLDQVAHDKVLTGRGLLKIDVQFAEHLVLAGAKTVLSQVDALIVELSLVRYNPRALIFPEMYNLIQELGFRYYEDVGGWRSPVDGTTLQKDVLFVRNELFTEELGTSSESEKSAEPALLEEPAAELAAHLD